MHIHCSAYVSMSHIIFLRRIMWHIFFYKFDPIAINIFNRFLICNFDLILIILYLYILQGKLKDRGSERIVKKTHYLAIIGEITASTYSPMVILEFTIHFFILNAVIMKQQKKYNVINNIKRSFVIPILFL